MKNLILTITFTVASLTLTNCGPSQQDLVRSYKTDRAVFYSSGRHLISKADYEKLEIWTPDDYDHNVLETAPYEPSDKDIERYRRLTKR